MLFIQLRTSTHPEARAKCAQFVHARKHAAGLIWVTTCIFAASSASAQLPPPPKEVTTDANGVDVRTGNVTFEARELDIGPEGELGLHLARSIIGGTTRDSFDSTYYLAEMPDGQWSLSASFGKMGDSFGTFGTDTGAFYQSNYDQNTPTLYQHRSGVLVSFGRFMWSQPSPFGDNSRDDYRLADTVTYPGGLKLRIHYKFLPGPLPGVRIQSVTSNAGYQIKFRYATNITTSGGWNKRVAAIAINMAAEYCDPEADECSLALPWPTTTYSESLEGSTTSVLSVTDAAGEVTTYRNTSGSSPRFSIALPGSTAEARKYTKAYLPSDCTHPFREPSFCSMGDDYRVVQFQNNEKVVTYSYNYKNRIFDQIASTEPDGAINTYKSWGFSQLGIKSITDAIGESRNFEYNQKGLITKAIWPEGNYVAWQRDVNGNVTLETVHSKDGSQTLSQSQVFGTCAMGIPTCSLPMSTTDARGNTTDFRYNPRGQKIAQIGPPAGNGVRPLTRWVYVDRYAYIKAPNGALVQANSPVSVLSKMIVCRSSFNGSLTEPACASAADEVVTTYEFASTSGPNALLPIGQAVSADGEVSRTCYGYDLRGNRIWERAPGANLASCE